MTIQNEAYLLFSFAQTGDIANFGTYAAAADEVMAKYGGELVVAGAPNTSISKFEGAWPDKAGLTLIKFPSRQHLEDFWASGEYQDIVDLRTAILASNFTIGFSNP